MIHSRVILIIPLIICMLSACVTSNTVDVSSESDVTEKADESLNLDYNKYINKVWTADLNNEIKDNSPAIKSFLLKKVDNKTQAIEGEIVFGYEAFPTSYRISAEHNEDDSEICLGGISFNGVIKERIAKCDFKLETGNKGVLKIELINYNKIKAKIEIDNPNSDAEINSYCGEYIFTPYNINDVKDVTLIKKIPTTLNYWGEVNITTGYINGNHPYAVAFITDENDNILFNFDGMTNGYEIQNVIIEDVNGDGLKDVRLFFYEYEKERLEYIFIQKPNGYFYDSRDSLNPNIRELTSLP